MLCITLGVYAIPPDWLNPAGREHFTFYVSLKTISTNNRVDTLGPGDGFAVFGTVSGVQKCLGYRFIDNETDTLDLHIAADTLATVTNLKIKFWSGFASCVRSMNYVNTNMVLADSSYFILGTLSFFDLAQISYPKDTLYTNETSVRPLLSDSSLVYGFSGSGGLSIDQATGAINAKTTPSGLYTVSVTTNVCYYGNDINIYILDTVDTSPKLDSSQIHFRQVPSTCDTKGSIFFEGTVPQGTQFTLQGIDNESNRFISASGNFTDVNDGIYQIYIGYQKDTLTYKETFVFSVASGCGNPVFNFSNSSGVPASIYLEKPGVVHIYNRDGKLVKTLEAPATWNGTDQSGNDVPMGDYYLYLNEHKEQTITILR